MRTCRVLAIALGWTAVVAVVIMSQHLDRMALRPDNQAHYVETWATQRET